jgi:hypothetical protein
MEDQETTYTVKTPAGITDYLYAETMFDAYKLALEHYGPGVVIRPSFYKEWTCGTKALAEFKGGCYYDEIGNHVVLEAK